MIIKVYTGWDINVADCAGTKKLALLKTTFKRRDLHSIRVRLRTFINSSAILRLHSTD